MENENVIEQDIDVNSVLAENERLKEQLEADRHIKERLAKKAEKSEKSPEIDKDALYSEFKHKQQMESWLENNPHLTHLEEDFKSLTSTGLSHKEATMILENRDPTIAQRKKTESMNLTPGDLPSKNEYTKSELEGLDQYEYNRVMNLKDQGKIRVING